MSNFVLNSRIRNSLLLPFLLLSTLIVSSQDTAIVHGPYNGLSTPNKNRINLIAAVNIGVYTGSLFILNQAWYANYPRSSFHFFNDNKEWLQVDKVGHGWTAYNTGRASAAMWQWAGLPQKKAALIGGISGAAYLTVIEILDGFSSQWGFSWGDMTANVVGSGLFTAQELLWKEQRIQYKFSFHRNTYDGPGTQRKGQ